MAAPRPHPSDQAPREAPCASELVRRVSLNALLDAAATTPRPACLIAPPPAVDPGDRPLGALTDAAQLHREILRLARIMALARLPAGSAVLFCGLMDPDLIRTVLAAQRLGLRPVLVPVWLTQADMRTALDGIGPCLALAGAAFEGHSPAQVLRDAAARSFNVRLVASFEADPPDGVLALHAMTVDDDEGAKLAPPGRHYPIGFVSDGGQIVDVVEAQILDTGLQLARLAGLRAGCRIVSTLVGLDAVSLATGFVPALLASVAWQPLGIFSERVLVRALAQPGPVCLVLPGALELALHQSGLGNRDGGLTVVLVHRNVEAAETRACPPRADALGGPLPAGLRLVDLHMDMDMDMAGGCSLSVRHARA